MSRLIVKNLPSGLKEDKLRSVFGKIGDITDCTLKYTKDGRFRKFAFIGFSKEEEAANAVKSLNKTFINTSRIQVEYAKDFGDDNKPRAWSKYSKDSSAFQSKESALNVPEKKDKPTKSEKKKTAKDKALEDMMGELKDDPKFEEFLEAHVKGSKKQIWGNDATDGIAAQKTGSDDSEDDSSDESDSGVEGMEVDQTEEDSPKKLSDLDYLKSKMSDQALLSDSDDSDGNSDKDDEKKESNSSGDDESKERGDKGDIKKESNSSDDDEMSDNNSNPNTEDELLKPKVKEDKSATDEKTETEKKKFVIKLRGFTGYVDKKVIGEFFKPLQPSDIRIPWNAKKKPIGVAFIEFKTEKEWDEAMRKNKLFIGGKRIFLKKIKEDTLEDAKEEIKTENTISTEKQKQEIAETEATIADTGRLFVRNLPYVCKEEDLEVLFSKFGLLTEIHLPIDPLIKKIKGFAFITYMIPEHAVKAFTSLDGTSFMGRMLHILPAKSKDDEDTVKSEGSSFKTEKQAKQKAMANSSHNWNTLFLGANAVANVMAEKYGTDKSHILDAETSGSLGVRLALGETQIVSETRDFLIENGVVLDSFSQPGGPRSKTVILVKNLPSGTKSEELHSVFSKHGTLGRVILPPSGITAIVEFLEPTEAKLAYKKLAYTKFQHVPLYLEWAPTESLKPINSDHTATKQDVKKSQMSDDDEEEETAEVGSTVFVKNLNFDTTDESLKQKFEKCGKLKAAYIAKKKDLKNPGKFLSMGYGFVEYMKKQSAEKALKTLQHTDLDGHQLELKISNKATIQPSTDKRKNQSEKKAKTSKILVRNVPFEAKRKEIYELFKVFGELKSVRLPKKLSGTGSHRGFAFVDFLTRQDAKRAFEALCHSTHLYGRRLVLEWAESAEDLDELRKKTAEHFHEDVPTKKIKKSAIMEQLESSEQD